MQLLVRAGGLTGLTVPDHEHGISLDVSDVSAVADAIWRRRQDEVLLRKFGDNRRCLARNHTGTAFAESNCDALAADLHRNSITEGSR
jgi:hypothetical protein